MCRGGCTMRFLIPGNVVVAGSSGALDRDAHELSAHAYVHVPDPELIKPNFASPLRQTRGRLTKGTGIAA